MRVLCPGVSRVQRTECRTQAYMRSAYVALACERYRLKDENGEWPAKLDDLVKAKLLDKVPTDPIDNQPLPVYGPRGRTGTRPVLLVTFARTVRCGCTCV